MAQPMLDTVATAAVILSAVFLTYQLYLVFVYPYFVSPLRHLPGPKVTNMPAPETYTLM
jgi:hypothetical protein